MTGDKKIAAFKGGQLFLLICKNHYGLSHQTLAFSPSVPP